MNLPLWLTRICKATSLASICKMGGLFVSLCLHVCDTVGALPEKQEVCPEWCHSFQAENVVVAVVVFPMVHENLFSFGTHHQKFTSFLALKTSWWRGEEEDNG